MIDTSQTTRVCLYCYETFTAASDDVVHCDNRDCREQHLRRLTREQVHPDLGRKVRRGFDWAVPAHN